MFKYLAAFGAVVVLLVAAGSANAHDGARVVFVPDGFGGARAVVVNDHFAVRGFHHGGNVVVGGRGVVVRGNRSFFNQNGGRNRLGFRR